MNWLLYVGGFIGFLALWNFLTGIKSKSTTLEVTVRVVSALMVWIWLCTKYAGIL